MQDVGIKLKARIDTGAGVSSIDARIVQVKPGAGGSGERVVFEIRDDEGVAKTIERKIGVKAGGFLIDPARTFMRQPGC